MGGDPRGGYMMRFHDRAEAGRLLGERLRPFAGRNVVVLALPKGGVPVAFEVAQALAAPLDLIVVRKLGVPVQPELAMGAIGEDGVRVLDGETIRMAQVGDSEVAAVERRERRELERQAEVLRGERDRLQLHGRTAIVVDDGIATGATARAACLVSRAHGAARVVLAAPVAPRPTLAELAEVADEVVCLEAPDPFFAVGQWYRDFSQVSDDEVVALLRMAGVGVAPAATLAREATARPARDESVEVQAGQVRLRGHLSVPAPVEGLVIFAHGSGSSRRSPRNRFVARALGRAGLGTLLLDLLTPEEELERSRVFDVELLADRLGEVTHWLQRQSEARGASIGYFGASTGAAAALSAAAQPDAEVAAIVSRGGRPDLTGQRLAQVRAPTLLIVGGEDEVVLELNRRALQLLGCEKRLAVVPRAGHLFEEPGALETVAELASDWFASHLAPGSHGSRTIGATA